MNPVANSKMILWRATEVTDFMYLLIPSRQISADFFYGINPNEAKAAAVGYVWQTSNRNSGRAHWTAILYQMLRTLRVTMSYLQIAKLSKERRWTDWSQSPFHKITHESSVWRRWQLRNVGRSRTKTMCLVNFENDRLFWSGESETVVRFYVSGTKFNVLLQQDIYTASILDEHSEALPLRLGLLWTENRQAF